MPYPRLMRLLIPFSYFIFYQYGVIVRPYGLMLLVFLFLALAFPQKDNRPWRFAGLLMLLCLTNAYGIVIAGGIAVCWVYELVREKGIGAFVKGILKDSRTQSLGALLVFAILLIWMILPRSDTLTFSEGRTNSFFLCLICALFTFLGECTVTTSSWFSADRVLLQGAYISLPELAVFCVIGLILWFLLFCASSKRSWKYLVIPYILFSVFSAAVFFNVHHLGIVLLIILFWAGILYQDERRFEVGNSIFGSMIKGKKDKNLLIKAAAIVFAACLLLPVYWSMHASVLEVEKEYSYGRSVASFIKAHGLDHCRFLAAWDEGGVTGGNDEELSNTFFVSAPVLINAYFDRNLCLNLNNGRDSEAYLHCMRADAASNERNLTAWRSVGPPELILGKPELEQLYENVSYKEDYTMVFAMRSNYIWKNRVSSSRFPMFARNDILERFGLHALDDDQLKYKIDGFSITPEMREAFENGVPMEEILKPYLDAMFGEED
jgi:hypothetical protein